MQFTAIESDQRKSAFLRTSARSLGLNLTVHAKRIEHADPQNADILSARALGSLGMLCECAMRHLAPAGTAILPKGQTWQDEIAEAQQKWRFKYDVYPSTTASEARILAVKEINRV